MGKSNHSRSLRDVKKRLSEDGWYLARTKSSHGIYKHRTKKGRVVVVDTQVDIPTGTLKDIYDAAGWEW